jgi:hypothetical protein
MSVRDRANLLLTDLLLMVNDHLTNTLRPQMLARIRDELDEAKQEGFSEAQEMRRDENN